MIRYLTIKEFQRINGNCLGVYYKDDSGNDVIELPFKASTMTRLHEIGHVLNGDNCGDYTFRELFECEVKAELFAYETMNRPLNMNVLIPAINRVADYHYLNTVELFKLCLDSMAKYHIPYDAEDRSNLWHKLKSINKVRR